MHSECRRIARIDIRSSCDRVAQCTYLLFTANAQMAYLPIIQGTREIEYKYDGSCRLPGEQSWRWQIQAGANEATWLLSSNTSMASWTCNFISFVKEKRRRRRKRGGIKKRNHPDPAMDTISHGEGEDSSWGPMISWCWSPKMRTQEPSPTSFAYPLPRKMSSWRECEEVSPRNTPSWDAP